MLLIFARFGAIAGNLLFGVLIDTHCAIPIGLVAVLLGMGGLMSTRLPDMTRLDIQ